MKINKYFILIFISLVLISCSSFNVEKDIEVKSPPIKKSDIVFKENREITVGSSAPLPAKPAYPAIDILSYRSFLFPNDKINISSVSFIYLPHKPISEKEIEQYNNVCKIWLNSFQIKEDIEPYITNNSIKLIPLYWPLKKKINSSNCSEMIEHYDYGRMEIYSKNNKLNMNKIMLLAQFNKIFVTMDISNLDIENLILSINTWKEKLCTIPKKSTTIEIKSIIDATKKVLGVLSNLIGIKTKS